MTFKVTVQQVDSNFSTTNKIEVFDHQEFPTKKEANSFKREMIKKHDMIKHAGHVVNYSDQKELFTNY